MRLQTLVGVLLAMLPASAALLAEDSSDTVTDALQAALARNIDHAKEWFDQKDYKSVAQSAGSLQFLAELLKARGDGPAWQASLDHVISSAGGIQTAARDEEAAKCKAALESL